MNFNLQEEGRDAADGVPADGVSVDGVPAVAIRDVREIQRGNMDIRWKLYKL